MQPDCNPFEAFSPLRALRAQSETLKNLPLRDFFLCLISQRSLRLCGEEVLFPRYGEPVNTDGGRGDSAAELQIAANLS